MTDGYRKRLQSAKQEDLALTEVSKINFDHQRQRKRKIQEVVPNGTEVKTNIVDEQTSGCYTVANRTLINKVLYTNEDAPPMVLIHVPPVLRPNGNTGTLYFQFETTYFLEVECYYEALDHPQKVPLGYHKCALEATFDSFDYENYVIVPPNCHFHGQIPKGMQHNRGTHTIQKTKENLEGVSYGKFINK